MKVRAEVVGAAAGHELLVRFDAADAAARLAGSPAWCRAAAAAGERLVHVTLHDDRAAEPVGLLVLARGHAGWRSGSPGLPVLRWPMPAIGYGFGPRFAPHAGDELRAGWLAALAARFPRTRLELRRLAPDAVPVTVPGAVRDGTAVWCAAVGEYEAWLAGLKGDHRRDLAKYRRKVAAAGGVWHDVDAATAAAELHVRLSALFALHDSRLAHKGVRGARLTAAQQRFFRELAALTQGSALRLSLLQCDGRWIAGCLGFTWRGRYEAFVSGWSRSHPRLDLGRQAAYHQVLGEFARGGLRVVDFLGGDLDYKREFGLQRVPTPDLVVAPGVAAAWRERVVAAALSAWRRTRERRLAPSGIGARS